MQWNMQTKGIIVGFSYSDSFKLDKEPWIGDEFLALYHCVRSLAVKETFLDAWNNLILLFEKVIWSPQVLFLILQNRSSPLKYVSSEVCFEFFKRSGRIREESKEKLKDDFSNYTEVEGESNHFTDPKLWSLMVRMTSFLIITWRYILKAIISVFSRIFLELSFAFLLFEFPLAVKLSHSCLNIYHWFSSHL